jgi:hypothetical protein
MRADDALKYAAAILKSRTQWAGDSIAGSDECNGHNLELEAIDHTVTEICRLTAQFGDPRRYSDGRLLNLFGGQNGDATRHRDSTSTRWHDPASGNADGRSPVAASDTSGGAATKALSCVHASSSIGKTVPIGATTIG